MTLKNEFLTAHSISGGIGMNEKQAVQCVRIADELAIDFAKWCVITQAFGLYGYEKALEIYKQEKGL